jgi:ParB family transcriptional regulator, chromosome partitioning protein
MLPTPETRLIPISQIRPDPTPNRKVYDPESLKELQASMAAEGLKDEISVRLLPDDGSGKETYELIDGGRRLLGAKGLAWTEIRADVYPVETTPTQTEKIALIADTSRSELSPIELARAYDRLLKPPHDLSQEGNRDGAREEPVSN